MRELGLCTCDLQRNLGHHGRRSALDARSAGSVGLATMMIRALSAWVGVIHAEALPACSPEAPSGSSFPAVPGTRGSSPHPRGSLAALIAANEREIGAAQIRGLGPPPGGRSPGLPASPAVRRRRALVAGRKRPKLRCHSAEVPVARWQAASRAGQLKLVSASCPGCDRGHLECTSFQEPKQSRPKPTLKLLSFLSVGTGTKQQSRLKYSQ